MTDPRHWWDLHPRRRSILIVLIIFLVGDLCNMSTVGSTRTSYENTAWPGTSDWQIPLANIKLIDQGGIEGFASKTSVGHGGTIKFFVNTRSSIYQIDFFRMGWYGGLGSRWMDHLVNQQGVNQKTPCPMDRDSGLIECNWLATSALVISADWPSGVYLAKLTALDTGGQNYIIFTVRNESSSRADILFQSAVTTWQAYNNWGGKSSYDVLSDQMPVTDTSPAVNCAASDTGCVNQYQASKISFNRPYASAADVIKIPRNDGTLDRIPYQYGSSAGRFFSHELPLLRWLESQGYEIDYITSIDTQERWGLLDEYKVVISAGHDEYWTWDMREAFQRARDGGTSLVFMGADAAYGQIRLEPGHHGENRTQVFYRPAWASKDPSCAPLSISPNSKEIECGGADYKHTSILWRMAPVGRPEAELVGIMYGGGTPDNPYPALRLHTPNHWAFEGTGGYFGQEFPGIIGHEWDTLHPSDDLGGPSVLYNRPNNLEVLFSSPFSLSNGTRPVRQHTTLYRTPSGALVFASGTMKWAWGLDDIDYGLYSPESSHGDAAHSQILQKVTDNVIQKMLTQSSPNLVLNGSLENLDYWQKSGHGAQTLASSPTHSGRHSLHLEKVKALFPPGSPLELSQSVTIKGGEVYSLAAWVYLNSGNGSHSAPSGRPVVLSVVENGTGLVIARAQADGSNLNQWQLLRATAAYGDSGLVTTVRVVVTLPQDDTDVYIDDVSLRSFHNLYGADPSFEAGTSGAWPNAWYGKGLGALVIDRSQAKEGSASLKITATGVYEAAEFGGLLQENKSYILRGWVKILQSNGGGEVALSLQRTDTWGEAVRIVADQDKIGQWQVLTTSGTFGASDTLIPFQIKMRAPAGSEVLLDDLAVVEANNLLTTNPSFEAPTLSGVADDWTIVGGPGTATKVGGDVKAGQYKAKLQSAGTLAYITSVRPILFSGTRYKLSAWVKVLAAPRGTSARLSLWWPGAKSIVAQAPVDLSHLNEWQELYAEGHLGQAGESFSGEVRMDINGGITLELDDIVLETL
jgi:hypothetical protein